MSKESKLRVFFMILFMIFGLLLTIWGWTITGKLLGLGLMLAGIAFLLTSLYLYNKPYK